MNPSINVSDREKELRAEQLRRARTVADFCYQLSISRSHFYDLVSEGRIKTIKIGGRTLVPETELERIVVEGC